MPILHRPDICVIGAGSGGLTVAAAAASFGVPVVLIERGKMGGDCLNYGCVPSKALIAAGKQAHRLSQAAAFGVSSPAPEIDFDETMRHVRRAIAAIAPNDSVERFTALGVTVIPAEARFTDPRTVVAGDHEIRARRFVIATGSSPVVPPIPGLDGIPFLTNETIFEQESRPGHLVIIGGGPVGMELAQAHRRLGSDVTVIEAGVALGKEDPELAAVVLRQMRTEGVEIIEHAKVLRAERNGVAGIRVHVEGAEVSRTVEGSHLLVAAGRRPNLEALALERAGIAYDAKGIQVSGKLRTTNRRVYAIGDVAGGLQFTHVANHHAGLVIRALLFRLPARQRPGLIPRATFTDPELAHIGITEAEARESGGKVTVLRSPFAENDRAQTERLTQGFIKLIAGPRGRILGVSIVGQGAAEMMHFWSLALSKRLTLRDIAGYVAPYPTLGEVGKRMALSYYAGVAGNHLVRRLVGFLRLFG
ncbi:FAD-dependent oxidoreductase [Chelativorans sp.]|uniref:dihydrolipoyl dehydrogenase family protein n=1 Tax=Chelativorans sp. TaxID=2203393 RepID=UPI002810DFD8|nr:FAD-dependent oxidoreductase [Chelativorans sp.]